VQEVWAVYNPNLVNGFANYLSLLKSRLSSSADTFGNRKWMILSDSEQREFIYSKYLEYLDALVPGLNNTNDVCPLVPVIHGTDLSLAWRICTTGFVALSNLDAGFYGKGIYFTTHTLYAYPYFQGRDKPSIIISFIIPGNIYPTTESPTVRETSLLGKGIVSGYNSHFILTNKDGSIFSGVGEAFYDEFVVAQESQICPAYVMSINTDTISKVGQDFEREAVHGRLNDKKSSKYFVQKKKKHDSLGGRAQELEI